MLRKSLPALALIALISTGCSTAPKAYVPVQGDSFALSVTKAAGYKKLRDVPAEDGEIVTNVLTGGAGRDILDAGFLSTQILAPPPGLSSLGAGVFGIFSLLANSRVDPETGSSIMAWVPKALAPTHEEAIIRFNQAVVPAARATFDRSQFPGLTTEPDPRHSAEQCMPLSGCKTYDFFYFRLTGGRCQDAEKQYCWAHFGASYRPERDSVAPAFIGGQPAWRVSQALPPWARAGDLMGTWYAAADELAFYTDISRQLPDWAFIYIAPRKAAYRDKDGSLKLLPYPVVIHRGTIHYFIAGAT